MSHIHIPDGIIEPWFWIMGFIFAGALLILAVRQLKKDDALKKIPLLGVISAIMLLAMSLEIVPIAYHVNLAVLAGIILGPALGIISAFIVNLLLAFFGHGGITVLGLNILSLSMEVILGFVFFKLLRKGKINIFWSGFLAAFITLAISTVFTIFSVSVGVSDLRSYFEVEDAGVIGLFFGDQAESFGGAGGLNVKRFAAIILFLGFLGWLIEGVIVGLILRYLEKIKPDLIK